MSMSKQQIVGMGLGGVFLVAAGVLGYLLFDAASERSETEENLADATDRFARYNEAPVFASAKSIASVKSNETSYATWRKTAMELVSRGDQPPPAAEEPSVFKQRLQSEVRRMGALSGGVSGHIAAPEFLFGFEQYLGESGVLPQPADVPGLAIQLDAIAHVVDMFAQAGVLEVKSVVRIAPKATEEDASGDAPKKGKNKNKSKKKAEKDDAPRPTCREYTFEILARPAAVVEVLNRLSSDVRFMVVRNLSFQEPSDVIVSRISAKEAAESQAASPAGGGGGGRRRRRSQAMSFAEAEGEKSANKVDALVVDPEIDVSVQVSFTLAVYDFGNGATVATAAETTGGKDKDDAAPQSEASTSKKEAK